MALPQGYTPEAVAEALQINPDRVRQLIRDGKVGCLRASRMGIRLLDKHVDELIAALEVPAAATGPTVANPFGATARSARANRTRKPRPTAALLAAQTTPPRAQAVHSDRAQDVLG